jgi:hypothetical protein
MIFKHLLVVSMLLGFGAPWTIWLYRRAAEPSLEYLLDRICFGYALSFVLLFALSWLRLWVFLPVWALGTTAVAFDAWRRPRSTAEARLGRDEKVLLAAAALYLGLRCLPFLRRELPLGWDAYFHMTIAESIVERGHAISDWLPFEDIPLNYPIGAHLLLALGKFLSHLRPHHFFELMVVWFTLLTGLQIFVLSARASGSRTLACYAALAYLFLADMGSLQYATWSGLPNLIGVYLLLGALTSLMAEAPDLRRATPELVAYFLAACFVHHHVMVTAALTLGFVGVALWLSGDRARAKRVALGLVGAGLLGAPFFVMYLRRTSLLAQTGLAAHLEEMPNAWDLIRDVGLGFAPAAVAGICLAFRGKLRNARVPTFALVVLLGLYLGGGFGVRTFSLVLFDKEMAPFTPSRFLTDAVALLALFAGLFFFRLQGEAGSVRLSIAASIVAAFLFFNRASYADTFREELPRDRLEVYAWIREHAAPNAALLDRDLHATYFTRRMSSSFPLPTSEFRGLAANHRALQAVAAGKKRPRSLERQVLAVVEPKARAPRGQLVFESPSGLRVVELVGQDAAR